MACPGDDATEPLRPEELDNGVWVDLLERSRAGHRVTLANLPVALRECHRVTVVDNTASRGRRVLETRHGEVTYAVDPRPRW